MTLCCHCNEREQRTRGLCFVCEKDPELVALYPSRVRWKKTEERINLRPAAKPSPVPIWDPAFLDVLAERVRAGEELWHPEDIPLGMR